VGIVGPRRRWWKVGIEPSGRQGGRRQPRSHTRRRSWQWRSPPRRRRQSRSSRRRRAAIEVPSRSWSRPRPAHRSRWPRRSSAISHHRPRRRTATTHRRPSPSRRTHAHTRPSAGRAHHAHVPWTTHPTRGRGREARPDPRPLVRLVVDVKLGPGHQVVLLSPSRRQGRHFGVGPNVRLLRRRQPHGTGPPLAEILLVVQLEVLPELPPPALLLPSRGRVMGQVRVGIVVEEAGHRVFVLVATAAVPCVLTCRLTRIREYDTIKLPAARAETQA